METGSAGRGSEVALLSVPGPFIATATKPGHGCSPGAVQLKNSNVHRGLSVNIGCLCVCLFVFTFFDTILSCLGMILV